MTHSSAGARRERLYELIIPLRPQRGRPSRGRGLDEAEYFRCALKHAQKPGSPNRPTYACSGWRPPDPTAKRSVTHAATPPQQCHKTWELDIYARLEKRKFRFRDSMV